MTPDPPIDVSEGQHRVLEQFRLRFRRLNLTICQIACGVTKCLKISHIVLLTRLHERISSHMKTIPKSVKKTASGRTMAEMESINTGKKIPVSERALIARINRRLAVKDESLEFRKSRSEYMRREWGAYHVLNTRLGVIRGWKDINLESFAKKCGALKPYEKLAK
jgi:hypothetical protein